jgi:hypothetical protein
VWGAEKIRNNVMKAQLRQGILATALLTSASVAFAAVPGSASQDNLNLSSAQQKEIWQSVSKQNMKETPPVGFRATMGEVVPSSVQLHALPSEAARKVPAVTWYDYAMLQNQLILVDPKSKKIAEIIRQ